MRPTDTTEAVLENASETEQVRRAEIPVEANYLADGYEDRFSLRVAMRNKSDARFHNGVADVVMAVKGELVVAEVLPEEVRIIDDIESARVLVWVRREDAEAVVVRSTTLQHVLGAAMDGVGVTVEPGLVPALYLMGDEWDSVTFEGTIEATGWMPTSSIGDVFQPTPTPSFQSFAAGVRAPETLRDAPAGEKIASFAADAHIELLDGAVDGWQRVAYQGRRIRAVGWIPTAAVTFEEVTEWGTIGTGNYCAIMGTKYIPVPEHTCLFDPDGHVVGTMTEHGDDVMAERKDDRYSIQLKTHCGYVQLWLQPADGWEDDGSWPKKWRSCALP